MARALGPEAQGAELAPVADFLGALQPAITHYKCCSTFDSTPEVGNLALGVLALRQSAHDAVVTVVGGQPSLGRYCAFGNLFASVQTGGVAHRIDRHPTMSRHPVTPMHEADLRRHLSALGLPGAALIDLRVLDTAHAQAPASETLDRAIAQALKAQPPALLFDTMRAEHLGLIGRWLWQRAAQRPQLVLGASSVAQAALAHWPGRPPAAAGPHGSGPRRVPACGAGFPAGGQPVTGDGRPGEHAQSRVRNWHWTRLHCWATRPRWNRWRGAAPPRCHRAGR